jgi:hypothetical protein
MGMPPHEFLSGGGSDAIDSEAPLLRGDLGLHEDIDQKVAKLLLKIGGMLSLDGIDNLVCLLDQGWRKRGRSLFTIPGAPAGCPQSGDDPPELIE